MYIEFSDLFNITNLLPFIPFVFGIGKDDEEEAPPPPPPVYVPPPPVYVPPPPPTPPPPGRPELSPLERKQLELAIRRAEIEIAQLEAPPPPPSPVATINPEIEAAIYGSIEARTKREADEQRRRIAEDFAARNLRGAGPETEALRLFGEDVQRRLDDAARYAATQSVSLGQSQADVNLRNKQIAESARQFDVGLASQISNLAEQRALDRFSTLNAPREAALGRVLTSQDQALRQREQDSTLAENIAARAEEARKRKQSAIASILKPVATFTSTLASQGAKRLLPGG